MVVGLAAIGLIVSAIISHVIVSAYPSIVKKRTEIEGILWYQRILPISLCHACTLAFGNLVYLYLDIGFIQMLKSFTPVVIILSSCLGLAVNYLSYYVIQETNSLTLKVLGTFRNVFLIFVGVFLYNEQISSNEMFGYGLSLIGFI
eukprot:gene21426-27754_t